MRIDIITIFPKMFESPFAESIVKRAQAKGFVKIKIHNLRKWTKDKHETVDGRPFGGGPGMILLIEPIYKALEEIDPGHKAYRILFTAKGERIMQEKVRELSEKKHLVLICGHYEGVDNRVLEYLVDAGVRLGDFILTGGEIPAMALVDAVVRLLPGVLGNRDSLKEESFSEVLGENTRNIKYTFLEYPQYSRPAVFRTRDGKVLSVPKVLLSGNHKKIQMWREKNRRKIKI